MVFGTNQLPTGKILRTDISKFMLFGQDTDVLRFFEQERSLRGSCRRKIPANFFGKCVGKLQLKCWSCTDESCTVQRRYRPHMSHCSSGISAERLHTTSWHWYECMIYP